MGLDVYNQLHSCPPATVYLKGDVQRRGWKRQHLENLVETEVVWLQGGEDKILAAARAGAGRRHFRKT